MLLLVFIKDHTSLNAITILQVFITWNATYLRWVCAAFISSLALRKNDEQSSTPDSHKTP